MTMPSAKERREVVKELRELETPGCIRYAEEFFEELREIVAIDLDGSFEGVAGSLVNLIDRPTCRNVSGYKDVFECSECRCKVELITEVCNEHDEPFHVPLMPSFCPNCGAEVVDDA